MIGTRYVATHRPCRHRGHVHAKDSCITSKLLFQGLALIPMAQLCCHGADEVGEFMRLCVGFVGRVKKVEDAVQIAPEFDVVIHIESRGGDIRGSSI